MATVQLHSLATENILRKLGSAANLAAMRALNKSIGSARTVMAREVSRDMGLKVGVVRDRIHIRHAAPTRLVAELLASPTRIPVYDFGAKGPFPSRGRGRGVSARLGARRRRYPHAFIAKMRSGHIGVFERSRTKLMRGPSRRQAIYELYGPSIAYVFEKHVQVGLARGEVQLQKNLVSELRFAAREAGARSVS
jgi:hypothetical protein